MASKLQQRTLAFVTTLLLSDTLSRFGSERREALELYGELYAADKRSKSRPKGRKIVSGNLSFVLPQAKYDEIEKLLADNKGIQAIKMIRELTGWGLKESKDAAELRVNFKNPYGGYRPPTTPVRPAFTTVYISGVGTYDIPQDVYDDISMTLAPYGDPRRGNKIGAIKKLREWFSERHGYPLGLREAKETCENTTAFPVLLN